MSHLLSLNPKKPIGPDGLSARYLKEIAVEIAFPLTELYKISPHTGVFPSNWKHCHITPVHKAGHLDDPAISILSLWLQNFGEDSVQLASYLEQHSLLHPYQGAYHCGRSTENIVLVATDYIVHFLDTGQSVCTAFLDFCKAFDSLDHVILLTKLYNWNTSPDVLMWFQHYLSDRSHQVKGDGVFLIGH